MQNIGGGPLTGCRAAVMPRRDGLVSPAAVRPRCRARAPADHSRASVAEPARRSRPNRSAIPVSASTVAGLRFPNPVGLAAGVDKDAEAIAGFFGLGFGSVEVGTLTPLPQPGNPQPRLFRLIEDRAVINRMGFNNGGLAAALPRIRRARSARAFGGGVLGINVGANKDAADRIADYVHGVTAAAPLADYVTINISSPNTPGLRDLQHGAALTDLLAASPRTPPARPRCS